VQTRPPLAVGPVIRPAFRRRRAAGRR